MLCFHLNFSIQITLNTTHPMRAVIHSGSHGNRLQLTEKNNIFKVFRYVFRLFTDS